MASWQKLEEQFKSALKLTQRPVAISFLDAVPTNVPRVEGSQPSGCSYWRLAAGGKVFHTLPMDHFNCAVGAYVHNIDLSPERAGETEETLKLMFGVGYIRPEDVPGIPRLKKAPVATVYAPLGAAPFAPSVVMFAGKPGSAMLLNEAAMRAGSGGSFPLLGRPTCMSLPASLEKGTVSSLGCIGNRVYTGLTDDDLYTAVPGADIEKVAAALSIIASANQALQQYAEGRRAQISTM
jgi:uncharacterized protein (DUF169 family)